MKKLYLLFFLIVFFTSTVFCFGVDEVQFEGKSLETWLQELIGISYKASGPYNRDESQKKAAEAFQRMGKREYDYLIASLSGTTNDDIHVAAIVMALRIGRTNISPEIPKLIALLNKDEIIAFNVAKCLGLIGTNSIPPLLRALSDNDAKVRQRAAFALGEIGPPARIAVPILLGKLKTDTPDVCCFVIIALARIRQYPDQVVPILVQNLTNENAGIRGASIAAIGLFGKAEEKIAPQLFIMLHDNDSTVRGNAAGALLQMNLDREFLPQLLINTSNSDGKVRCLIAQALGKYGMETNDVIPALLKLTKDTDPNVCESANFTLKQIGYK